MSLLFQENLNINNNIITIALYLHIVFVDFVE